MRFFSLIIIGLVLFMVFASAGYIVRESVDSPYANLHLIKSFFKSAASGSTQSSITLFFS